MKRKHLLLLPVFFLLLAQSAHARQAILSSLSGTVEIQVNKSNLWRQAKAKMFLKEGDKIRTGKRSKAVLLFEDGSRTQIAAETTLAMSSLAAPVTLSQTSGRTRHKIAKAGRGFTLRTPTAVCSVRGTEFEVGVAGGGETNLKVDEGIVNGMKTATGESMDVGAGQSLNFDDTKDPLTAPQKAEEGSGVSTIKELARKEVGLDMTRDQIQAAAAEEMKLAEYQEGKSLVDVNGFRVRLEEYILRRPKDVVEADRDKAFKFVVLNTRENRFDYFTYKGVFNKALPADLSVALRNASGRQIGDAAPEYYLTSYEMTQSNLTDALKDQADGGHLVQVTFDGTTYSLQAHSVNSDGSAGAVTDTVSQNASAGGKTYDPVADVYKNAGVGGDGVYDSANDTFRTMKQGETLWRTVFNRYVHMVGPAGLLANLNLGDAETAYRAGTLSQPYFQFYTNKDTAGAALTRTGGNTATVTNIATLEAYNNAALTADSQFPTLNTGKTTLTMVPDQKIGDAYFKYLNGRYAFDSTFPSGTGNLHVRLTTYYPKSATDIPFEQYDTYIISNEGKIAPLSAFAGATSGRAYKEELIKWNYEQITRSSSYGGTVGKNDGRTVDLVVEPKILIKSGLIK